MYKNKKVSIVLPAYNCSKTLEKTYLDIPFQIVDEVILVDDNSTDNTIDIALKLGINHVIKHHINLGYGANQKTCYNKALELNSDIIVMLHPDYQYTPLLIESMVSIIGNDLYDYKNLKNEQIINSKKYLKIYPEDSIILIEGYIYLYLMNNYKNPLVDKYGYQFNYKLSSESEKNTYKRLIIN